MLAFLIALAFGALQMYLLNRLVPAVTAGEKKILGKLLLLKFVTYAVAISLFVFKFLKFGAYCFCGFMVGFPLTAIGIFVYRIFFQKDDCER